MTFNYVDYLYFNPELQAFSNVITIENAITYLNNIPHASNLIPNINSLPNIIEPVSILSTNRDTIPISYMNNVISIAMSNEGISSTEINSKSR
jgi:hypothetical protein